jgi:hypothetical protein
MASWKVQLKFQEMLRYYIPQGMCSLHSIILSEDEGSKLLRNVGERVPSYMALHPILMVTAVCYYK